MEYPPQVIIARDLEDSIYAEAAAAGVEVVCVSRRRSGHQMVTMLGAMVDVVRQRVPVD